MPAVKRVPMRMCAICRQQYPKRSLIRLTKTADGLVSLDDTGKKPGRGLYVCRSEECLSLALKGRRLEKAAGAAIGSEVLAELSERAKHEP
ncbi:MAG: YlxR family protein [Clostridiales bacterium]|nr:YlxR family protein [Clostridiales bacterium]